MVEETGDSKWADATGGGGDGGEVGPVADFGGDVTF